MYIYIFFFSQKLETYGNIKLIWEYRGFADEKRKLMYTDLINMSAPAHAFVIKDDTNICNNIHEQFEKRAATVLLQYRTNRGQRN